MMEQFEKVCKAMKSCLDVEGCVDCIRRNNGIERKDACRYGLMRDAIAMIRQQQEKIRELEAAQTARVVSLTEIKDGEPYWLSIGKDSVTRPVICVHLEDDARKSYITFAWQFGTFSWDSENYGKGWHCWTQRPTDEQREAVKWE